MKRPMLFFVALLLAGSARAGDVITAGELFHECQLTLQVLDGKDVDTIVDGMKAGACPGYMNGFLDSLSESFIYADENHKAVVQLDNVPGVTAEQAARTFVIYVQQHPEVMNQPAGLVLYVPLVAAHLIKTSPSVPLGSTLSSGISLEQQNNGCPEGTGRMPTSYGSECRPAKVSEH